MIYTKPFEFEGEKPFYNKDRDFKLEHFDLFLIFTDITKEELVHCKITQSLTSYIDNPNKIALDCIGLDIKNVEIDNKKVDFDLTEFELIIDLKDCQIITDQNISLTIEYIIKNPEFGLTFIKPDADSPKNDYQVWSQGETFYTCYWIPIFDSSNQICTNTKTITTLSPFNAYSNGKIEFKKVEDDKIISKWVQTKPLPVCLNAIFVSAQEPTKLDNPYSNLEIANIIPKSKKQYEQSRVNDLLPEMIHFLSQKFGMEYPYEKYYQAWADNFLWGGMENTSLTINSSDYLLDDKAQNDINYQETLIVHELGHQWFGDTIVINNTDELWIKEGAAVFTEILWHKYKYTKDQADYFRFSTAISDYLEERQRPTILNYYQHPEDMYDRHSYEKAGLIYALIQKTIGNDKIFTRFLSTFLEDNKYKNVGYQDFIKAGVKTTGKNFAPIIDQYLKRSGHPVFESSTSYDPVSKTFTFNLKQTQYDSKNHHATLFILKNLEIDIFYIDKDKKVTKETKLVDLTKPEQSFYFSLDKKPAFATIDSDFYYAFEQEYKFGQKEIEDISSYHDSIIARITAINKLSKKANIKNLEFLKELFLKSSCDIIRENVAKALSKFNLQQAQDIIIELLQDYLSNKLNGLTISELISGLKIHKNQKSYDVVKSLCKNFDNTYIAQKTAYDTLGLIANEIGDSNLIDDTFKFLVSEYKNTNSCFEILEEGIISGIARLVENPEAFDFIAKLSSKGSGSKKQRTIALSKLSAFTKYNNPKFVPKIIDIYKETAVDSNLTVQNYLNLGLRNVSPSVAIQFVPVTYILENTSIHYRMQSGARSTRKSLIKKSTQIEANKKLLKAVDEKNKKIDKLQSELEEIKFKFEMFNSFMKETQKKDKKSE